jgi:hypothetical protein
MKSMQIDTNSPVLLLIGSWVSGATRGGSFKMGADFETKISVAVSKELADAHGDAERIGAMVERLASSLAFTIAVAAHGDPEATNVFLEGATAYLYEATSGHAKFLESLCHWR